MPKHLCVVPGCNNQMELKLHSFFTVPKDPEIRLSWFHALGIAYVPNPDIVPGNEFMCEEHFSPDQYKQTKKLIPNGRPSILRVQANQRQVLGNIANTQRLARNSPNCLEALAKNHMLNKESLKRSHNKISEKQNENKRLKVRANNLQAKLEAQKITFEQIKNTFADSKSLISILNMQVKRYEDVGRKHYTTEEKTIAITMYYSCSRNGYRTLLNLGFRLPALSTIRKWICRLKFLPGRNDDILDCLKQKIALMKDKELDCMLTLDETSIKKGIVYNRHTDAFEGFQTHGNGTVTMRPADHVLVVVVRFITTNLKIPLSYHFNASSTTTADLKKILLASIKDVTEAGARVRAVVTDQGGPNQGLVKDLGVSKKKPYFMHKNKKIYFSFDGPHLLKCFRNNLLNHGYVENKGTNYEKRAKWQHLVDVYEIDRMLAVRLCPKLTQQHFDLKHYDKMRVKWAAQVISKSLAAAVHVLVDNKRVAAEYLHTAEVIEKMDDIFDLLNISNKHDAAKPSKCGDNIYKNLPKLLEYRDWVATLKSGDGVHIPTLNGLQITLGAMHGLITDLKEEGYKYVLTRRLQSDCVEHLFSLLKMKTSGSPTATEFRHSFRYVFVSNWLKTPEGANCEDFENDELVAENEHKLGYFLQKFGRQAKLGVAVDLENSIIEAVSDSEFESDADDTNDDERRTYENNEYFRDLKDLEFGPTAANAAVLMAGWTIKKTIQKTKCWGCETTLLEFHMDRQEPGLDLDETLLQYKAYDPACFEKRLSLSYGQLVKEEYKNVFSDVAEYFPEKCFKSMNLEGSNVLRNTFRGLKEIARIRNWLEGETVPLCCKPHREDMLKRFLVARIFALSKQMTDDLK